MASPIGDAAAVDRLAGLFDRAAQELVDLTRTRARRIEGAEWQSPGADRYRRVTVDRVRECERQAVELQDLARCLRRHAAWVRQTEGELRDLERRIRAWAAAHPPNPADPAPDASLITWWPASMDPAWRDLAARLRANGAYF